MTIEAAGTYVSANGIDIHYVEAGAGEPLVLLHQGMVSTNPLWADSPVAYAGHMDVFADIVDVYRIKRNLFNRLQRNVELRRMYERLLIA